jgi:hypothetical protein
MIKNDLQIAPERWEDQEHSLDTIPELALGCGLQMMQKY